MVANKKIIIITSIVSVLAISATLIYLQYLKLMNYVIKFKSVTVNSISDSLVNINVFLNFENKSNIFFDIDSQLYSVLVNDKLIAKIGNATTIKIAPGNNLIPLAIAFNPRKTLDDANGTKGLVSFLLKPENTKIKIIISLDVKFYFMKVHIPYVYETNIKELLTKKQEKQ